MPITLVTAFMTQAAARLLAASGPLVAAKVGLFSVNVAPVYTALLADLTAPSYTGYAEVSCVFSTAYQDSDGSVVLSGAICQFDGPSDSSGDLVYGYFVTDGGTPEKLLWAERFPKPIQVSDTPFAIVFSPEYVMRPGNDNGSAALLSS